MHEEKSSGIYNSSYFKLYVQVAVGYTSRNSAG